MDDGSSDGSWSEICALGRDREDIRGVRLLRNVGNQNALAAGLAAAHGKIHVPMDVNLQDPAVVGRPLPARLEPGLYVFLRWSRAADFGCTVVFTIERDGHVLGEGARCPTS